jgi:ankyrin repeat protein
MEQAIRNGARIDDVDTANKTALIEALRSPIIRWDEADTVLWLLEHGADPNRKGDSGYRDLEGIPLHMYVAMNKHSLHGLEKRPETRLLAEEVLLRLLQAGAKVSGMDSKGRTPLHIAAQHDNERAAEILIIQGIKIMARDKMGKTPLDYAESASMIKLLKGNGATE